MKKSGAQELVGFDREYYGDDESFRRFARACIAAIVGIIGLTLCFASMPIALTTLLTGMFVSFGLYIGTEVF